MLNGGGEPEANLIAVGRRRDVIFGLLKQAEYSTRLWE